MRDADESVTIALGEFECVLREGSRVPGRWPVRYKFGRGLARWGWRAHHVLDEDCWCRPTVITFANGRQAIAHERGPEA